MTPSVRICGSTWRPRGFPPRTTRNRETAIKNRDIVAKQMTREQIDEAQRLAREWKPN